MATEHPVEDAKLTPVDDVRRIREQLHREANGDIHILAERARKTFEALREQYDLRLISSPEELQSAETSDGKKRD